MLSETLCTIRPSFIPKPSEYYQAKKIYPKRFLTWSLCRNATIPTRIRPIMKLPIDEKYSSDQSQIARHIKTTAKSPIM